MVVFIVALISAVTVGILEINTEEIQLMQNHVHIAEALAIADAGIEDAIMNLRQDKDWQEGFQAKPFAGGRYTVDLRKTGKVITISSLGTNASGSKARIETDVSITGSQAPYTVAVQAVRINP